MAGEGEFVVDVQRFVHHEAGTGQSPSVKVRLFGAVQESGFQVRVVGWQVEEEDDTHLRVPSKANLFDQTF